jgi:nicotinamide-nucleotide amidase
VTVSVISIGNELLNGDTPNTNLLHLGARLADAGVFLQREFCVPDVEPEIRRALRHALSDSDVVVTIGGLGPTCDDLTRPVVAAELGLPLREDPRVAATIREFLGRRGVSLPAEAVRLQSLVPESAEVLPNPNGTAPGLWCRHPRPAAVVLLPGPPAEFVPMVEAALLPRLLAALPGNPQRPRVVRVAGLAESLVEERVDQALRGLPPLQVAYCARPGCVTVRLTDPDHRADLMATAETTLRQAFADLALPHDCRTPAEHVARLLLDHGWRLAIAESCTGGLTAAAATDIPGSSAWFAGGLVTYADAWKQDLLGVRADTLHRHGAVSEPVVRQMLAGLRDRFGVQTAIAISGVAGPTGGTPEKPVGTVVVGAATPDRVDLVRTVFPGNRRAVR